MSDEVDIWTYFSKVSNNWIQCCICGKSLNPENDDPGDHLKSVHSDLILVKSTKKSKEHSERHLNQFLSGNTEKKLGSRNLESFVRGHFSKTSEKDKHKCLHCEKIIPSKNGATTNLRDHVIKYHRKQISQEEKEREKETNNFDIDSIEEGEKRPRKHSCHICGKLFVHKSYVRRHIDYHEKNFTHFCSYGDCRKGFVDMHALQKHAKFHSEERPFQCTTCGRGFKDNTHLKTHTRVHTGETPYHCLKCGKKFKFLATRNNHKCGIPLFLENNGDVM